MDKTGEDPEPASLAAVPQFPGHEGWVHAVQFYSEEEVLQSAAGRFIGDAPEAGDAGIVIVTPAHRERLGERLKRRHIEDCTMASQGRFDALDAADTLSKIAVEEASHQKIRERVGKA